MCLGNISKGFYVDNIKKTGLNGYLYDFSVDYNIIDTSNIINIHKYLMKKYDINKCLQLVKNIVNIVNASNQYKVHFVKQSETYDSTYFYSFTS